MLGTCSTCREPIHWEDFGSHGGWFIHSSSGRFFCSRATPSEPEQPKLCATHTYLDPTYGGCAPLHWPSGGPSRYRSAWRSRQLGTIDSLNHIARMARQHGETCSAERVEAEVRAIESYL
jgi:hypothetical protein